MKNGMIVKRSDGMVASGSWMGYTNTNTDANTNKNTGENTETDTKTIQVQILKKYNNIQIHTQIELQI